MESGLLKAWVHLGNGSISREFTIPRGIRPSWRRGLPSSRKSVLSGVRRSKRGIIIRRCIPTDAGWFALNGGGEQQQQQQQCVFISFDRYSVIVIRSYLSQGTL
mmetsp:Transcript_16268/g.35244  ORF Transcript_16268/g.35244 Transcript_16268/m.35244 type:complete len:104 (+) Transcript_16268:535-846(+)